MILLSVVVIIFIVIIMSIALHSFVCGKRKEILFECLVVLALEHQLGTLSTEINIKRKSIQINCWILRQGENRVPRENCYVQSRQQANPKPRPTYDAGSGT